MEVFVKKTLGDPKYKLDKAIRLEMDPDKRARLLEGVMAGEDWTLIFVSQERPGGANTVISRSMSGRVRR